MKLDYVSGKLSARFFRWVQPVHSKNHPPSFLGICPVPGCLNADRQDVHFKIIYVKHMCTEYHLLFETNNGVNTLTAVQGHLFHAQEVPS